MKAKLLAVTLISAFALSACGGGGGDSIAVNEPVSDNKPVNNEKPFTLQRSHVAWYVPANPNPPDSIVMINGKMIPLNFDVEAPEIVVWKNDSEDECYYKGHFVDYWDSSSNPNIISKEENDDFILLSGTDSLNDEDVVLYGQTKGVRGTAYARYGLRQISLFNDDTGKFFGEQNSLFYTGQPTTDMPKTGTATYLGNAVAYDMVHYNDQITQLYKENGQMTFAPYTGRSEFQVDFTNKKLTGSLNNLNRDEMPAKKAVSIDATIKANTFQGTANKTGYAEGKFYGPKAQNLAGAFHDKSQNLHGVFGANKQ